MSSWRRRPSFVRFDSHRLCVAPSAERSAFGNRRPGSRTWAVPKQVGRMTWARHTASSLNAQVNSHHARGKQKKIPRGKKKRGAQKNTSAAAVGSRERSEEQPSVRGVVDVLNVLGVLGQECHLPRFFGRRRDSRIGDSDRGPGTSPTLIGREFSSWKVLFGAVCYFLRGCSCRLLRL